MGNTANSSKTLPPKAEGHWFFGAAKEFSVDPINFMEEQYPLYEGMFRLGSPFKRIMCIYDPDYVKYILQENNRNYIKSFGYRVLEPMLGKGLLTSEGEFWRKQRRLAQPAFHRERLAALSHVMVECTEDLVVKLKAMPKKQGVNIAHDMMELALKVVGNAMFGSDISDEMVEIVGREVEFSNDAAIGRITNPFRLPMWIPTPQNIKEQRSIEKLDAVVKGLIAKRRSSKEQYDDLLAMLMEATYEDTGEGMSDQQLRDECNTIFLAGHETTALALSWLWYCLSQNPEVEAKLRKEVDEVLQGRAPQVEDLRSLSYTRMVIDETLRMYPPVWIIGRNNLEDDDIGGFHIPADTNVFIPTFSIHRNAEFWEQPNRFMPERFAKEKNKERHNFVYFPFGGGPRLCIGNNFALMEMQIIVAILVQNFKFTLSEGFEPEMAPLVTLRPKHGMIMDIEVL